MRFIHRLGWDPQFMQRSPWLWPLDGAAQALRRCTTWPALHDLTALYQQRAAACDAPALCFCHDAHPRARRADQPIAHESLYDGRISLRGEVPTRPENWHDLLNALTFATFPKSKHALHARQCAILARRLGPHATALPNARLPEQDALTLFDEGGVVIAAEECPAERLRTCSTETLCELLIALQHDRQARVVPFGHALFEHLVAGVPCPGATARVLAVDTLLTSDAALLLLVDRALSRSLEDPNLFLHPSEATHLRLQHLPDPV